MAKTPNIFLVGPMGAGKSTIGREVARALKLNFFDTDQEIEARTGADITWIFDIEGESGFRKREASVIDELTQLSNMVLATGGGAIVTPENRTALAARGTVVYLYTSLESQYERTRHDEKRPLLQTDDVWQRLQDLWAHREPLYQEIADISFNTEGLSVKVVANEIVGHMLNESK